MPKATERIPKPMILRWLIAGIGIGVLVGIFQLFRPHEITILDSRFELLNHRLSRRPEGILYDGIQPVEAISHWLRRRTGVSFTKRGALAVDAPGTACNIFLRYRGRFDRGQLDELQVILDNGRGTHQEVPETASCKGKNSFIKCYSLRSVPAETGPFHLILRLADGTPVARWELGRLTWRD